MTKKSFEERLEELQKKAWNVLACMHEEKREKLLERQLDRLESTIEEKAPIKIALQLKKIELIKKYFESKARE